MGGRKCDGRWKGSHGGGIAKRLYLGNLKKTTNFFNYKFLRPHIGSWGGIFSILTHFLKFTFQGTSKYTVPKCFRSENVQDNLSFMNFVLEQYTKS